MQKNPKRDLKRTARCDVALLVDIETGARARDGSFKVDHGSVEGQVLRVLRRQHRGVVVVPYDPDAKVTAAALRALQPQLVFNLTEWIDGDRLRDHEVVRLLERLRLPHTGAAPAGLKLTRDKIRANRIAARHGADVPAHFTIAPGAPARNPGLAYPLFVKPARGDGSDHISSRSLVRNARELQVRARSLHAQNAGLLLCEEYIPGCDLFVALLGNKPRVLHPMEFVVRRPGRGAPLFSTQRVKHDVRYQQRWRLGYRKARLPVAMLRHIDVVSCALFHALKLRDYGRLDFRLTPEGRLVFIEANANPDLARDGFCSNGPFVGVAYDDVIRGIVRAARERR